MARKLRWLSGGSDGNEQLTAIVATLLLVLLAIEGATLLNVQSLLTVHAFVGMLLIPVVALKLASTGWRMVRYYRRGEEYVRRGPPHAAVRMLVAPMVLISTVVLLATGVALLALDQTHGTIVGLHKASFFVWLGAMSLHVLTRGLKLVPILRRRLAGTALRLGLVGASLAAGLVLATLTLPAADHAVTPSELTILASSAGLSAQLGAVTSRAEQAVGSRHPCGSPKIRVLYSQ